MTRIEASPTASTLTFRQKRESRPGTGLSGRRRQSVAAAYWHTSGEARYALDDGKGTQVRAGRLRYHETDAARDAVEKAFAGARPVPDDGAETAR